MSYSYYPGCSLHSTASEYAASTEAVFAALGLELHEVPDWSCCGATSGHALSGFLAKALPLRNLILAEGRGDDVVVPCSACYNTLRTTQRFMEQGGEEAARLNAEMGQVMGRPFAGSVRVRHVVDVLTDPQVLPLVKERVKKPLQGMKLAAYYGCLITRPPKAVNFEANAEQPQRMDSLLKALGAQTVGWTHKNECCGASLSIAKADLVEDLVGKIVSSARRAGATAIAAACPLCQTNLDTRQPKDNPLPVFYLTELAALALGLPAEQFFKKHLVDTRAAVAGR